MCVCVAMNVSRVLLAYDTIWMSKNIRFKVKVQSIAQFYQDIHVKESHRFLHINEIHILPAWVVGWAAGEMSSALSRLRQNRLLVRCIGISFDYCH